ncbi:hypothetical protein [Fusobacterium varium]|uniref:hypothetical protein n=1 Tax=Fusobacterium varium TaxID=856 RepID=UPI002FE4620B
MKIPKFIRDLLKNIFGTKEFLLIPELYERFFIYEKNIILDKDYILHVSNRHRQHRVYISKNEKRYSVKELRSGWFCGWMGNPSIFIEDWTRDPMKRKDFKIEEKYSYVELVMDKKIRNISKYQNDNFPKSIKFLDRNRKMLLKLEFNNFGFMIRAINKEHKIIFEDKEVLSFDSTESFILSIIKE